MGGQPLEADHAATPTAAAISAGVHSGKRRLGFGQRGSCGCPEFATDLAMRGELMGGARRSDLDGAAGDVSELLTSEMAILVQSRSQNGELCGIEALVEYGNLMDHGWSSSAKDDRAAGKG
jgi:hypothetical protein